MPNDIARDVNTYFPSLRATNIFSFIADQWQVSPRLTASIGLRWELYPPMTPEHAGGFSNYNPFDNTLVIAGVGNNPSKHGDELLQALPGPACRSRLSPDARQVRDGAPLRFRPELYSVPGQHVRLQLPGPVEQRISLPPAEQLHGRIPAQWRAWGLSRTGSRRRSPLPIPSDGIIRNPDPTQAYFYIPKDYKNSYVMQWNFAIQQALPDNFVMDVAYVGSHGVDTGCASSI